MKATNKSIWVIRDKPETEKAGIILPKVGYQKPHTGEVISVGSLVDDKDIKSSKGKRAIFHQTVGQILEYKGVDYVILHQDQILGID